MYDEVEKDILSLFYEKKTLLDEILKYMQNTKFYDNDIDSEKYINLIEKREENICKIKYIDKKLNNLQYNKFFIDENNKLSDELKMINYNIQILIKDIIELDKKNETIVQKIKENLKKEIKELNNSKNLNSLYSIDNINQEGYYFDIKN